MTANEFDKTFAAKVRSERKITNEILQDVVRADREGYHLELGFASLYDWLTKGHKYSHGAAQRRVQAARLLKEIPEISDCLESGNTSLSTIADIQSAFNQTQQLGRVLSTQEKTEVVEQLQNKNGIEAKQSLMTFFPELQLAPQPDARQAVSHDRVKVICELTNQTSKKLDRVKEILSHKHPAGSMNDLLEHLCDYFLEREDVLKKHARKSERVIETITPSVKETKAVSRKVNRLVAQRADDQCEYCDPVTGRRCSSRYQIQTDHIKMRVFKGSNKPENLRRLCRAHNRYMAEKMLGKKWANLWRTTESRR